jgi:hypothetical protein
VFVRAISLEGENLTPTRVWLSIQAQQTSKTSFQINDDALIDVSWFMLVLFLNFLCRRVAVLFGAVGVVGVVGVLVVLVVLVLVPSRV